MMFVQLMFSVCVLLLSVSSAVIETPAREKNETENEIESYRNTTADIANENRSVETNTTIRIESSMFSFDNHSNIQGNASFVTTYERSSRLRDKSKLLNTTLMNINSSTLKITPNETHHTNSSKGRAMYPASAEPAIKFSATFQPVIKQKRKLLSKRETENNNLLSNSFDAQFYFLQKIVKALQEKISNRENDINQTLRNDALCQRQIRSIFQIAKFGTPSLLRCRHPETIITIKCISNIARVTFTSESEERFNARVSLHQKDYEKDILDGYKHNLYLSWWERNDQINTVLSQKLTREMVERKCESCRSLETTLKIETEKFVCLVPVKCAEASSQIIKLATLKLPTINFIRNTPVFALSMNFQRLDNEEIEIQKLDPGTPVDILIQATSDTLPVGVFVRECRIKSELTSVVILVNGCTISNFLDNFRIIRSGKNNKFVSSAKFIPFTIKDPTENHTFSCIIMVCEGMCDVRSACQNYLKDRRKSMQSKVITDVHVQTTYKILPEVKKANESTRTQPLNQSEEPMKEREKKNIQCQEVETSMAMKVCYMYLVILSFIFLLLISMVFFYMQREIKLKRNKIEEEIESPPRIFYHDECKARKRSPNNSFYSD